eukprot:535271_1
MTMTSDISVDDNATAITMDPIDSNHSMQDPHYMHSLSAELKSFQDANIVKASKSSMPKSLLVLMNSGITDSTGKLTKYRLLIINRTSTTEAEELIFQSGQSMKSIASDVSGMSSTYIIISTKI